MSLAGSGKTENKFGSRAGKITFRHGIQRQNASYLVRNMLKIDSAKF